MKLINIFSVRTKNFIYRQHWGDILLIVVLALAAGFASYQGAQLINPRMLLDKQTTDVWFHSDATRVFDDMTIYEIDHNRTNVHPLFLLIAFPPVYLLKTLSLEPITAVRIVIAIVAALWISSLFVLLRLIGCRRFDAALFGILGATSAAAVFWFVLPETYPFGSLSILLALNLVALTQHRYVSQLWYVLISALTLSLTVTNWMVGIFATIVNHRRKQSLLITLKAFCLVLVLVVVQKVIFPTSNAGFLKVIPTIQNEAADTVELGSGSETGVPLQVVKSFVLDTIVMPDIKLVENLKFSNWSRMTVQTSPPGSGSLWGHVAVVLWAALLGLGLWGFVSNTKHLRLRFVVGLSLFGQLALHAVYGLETFLYSLHFLPLLVVLAAFSTLTRARLLALVLAGAVVLSAGVNNGLQFSKFTEFSHGQGPLCASASVKCGVDSLITP